MSKNTIIGASIGALALISIVIFLVLPTPEANDSTQEEPVPSIEPATPKESRAAAESKTSNDEMITANIYFGTVVDGQEQIAAVQRELSASMDKHKTALYTLLEGPAEKEVEEGYITAISTGTTLHSFYVENGVAYADFSNELDASGSATVMMIRSQIEKTLLQFEDIIEVVISIEGETEEILEP